MPRLANTTGCEIEEHGERCGQKVYGHLMCMRHYTRWKRWGDPLGSAPKPTLADRFWAKVDKRGPDECWPWTNATITPAGYGQIGVGGAVLFAHRVAYELLVGPIPDGAELDHLCHTRDESCRLGDQCPHRRCVNPAHLEPVTQLVNNLRSRSPQADNARKVKCRNGHPLSGANLYIAPNGSRNCRKCIRAKNERRRAKEQERRTLGLPAPVPAKEKCRAGHRLIADNVGVSTDGTAYCRTCRADQDRERRRRLRESKPPRPLKISDEDAARIRQRWASGGVTMTALAAEYGVTLAYVSLIIKGKSRAAPAAA